MLVSKITSRAQTTLPSGVRKALGVRAGDKVAYTINGNHAVLRKAPASAEELDPALDAFLALLERDIATRPERLRAIPASLVARIRRLVRGVSPDPDEAIVGAVAL